MQLLLLHKKPVLDTMSSNVLSYVASYIAANQSYNHTVKVAEASKGTYKTAS